MFKVKIDSIIESICKQTFSASMLNSLRQLGHYPGHRFLSHPHNCNQFCYKHSSLPTLQKQIDRQRDSDRKTGNPSGYI